MDKIERCVDACTANNILAVVVLLTGTVWSNVEWLWTWFRKAASLVVETCEER